jgi:putative syringomycin transport system ATP-binding/permease protein
MTNMDNVQKPPKGARPNYQYQVLRLMWRGHPWLTIGSAGAGIASGLASIAVIDTINSAIHNAENRPRLLLAFIGLNAVAVLFRNGSSLLPAYAAAKIMTSLRIALCKRILATPLEEIDKRGVPNVLTLLTNDIPQLTQTLLILPTILVQAAVFVFGIAYLAHLSWIVFFLTIGFMLVGVGLYSLFFRKGMRFSRKVRDEFAVFNEYTHGLLFGIKELKLNSDRRRWFRRAAIDFSSKRMAKYNFIESIWFTCGGNVEQISFAILIGFLIFGAPSIEVLSAATLTACVLSIMYVMGPLTMLVSMAPHLGEGSIACERLAEFGFLINDPSERVLDRSQSSVKKQSSLKSWKKIELQDVKVDYRGYNSPNGFELGPINMGLRSGELVFIVGGNGSGKSTLAKVLTGLYSPTQGRILLDAEPVNDGNRDLYQSLFAAVFTDFHIFNRVIGPREKPVNRVLAQEYLTRLGLADKVQISDKKYSTTKALSNGQRKRLALLCAYMEDRPIYVLDEWAADQDPPFKKFFYEVLLPDLKSRMKCVIIITHDDQYFELADRIIKLRDGRVVSDVSRRPAHFKTA